MYNVQLYTLCFYFYYLLQYISINELHKIMFTNSTLITEHDICLPAMCQTVDFHLAMMRTSKLEIMVCALQYKCLQTPFNQSLRTLHPFSLYALIYMPEVIVLIYLPIPLCMLLITNYDKMTSGI